MEPGEAVELLESVSEIARFCLLIASENSQVILVVQEYLSKWRYVHPLIDGNYLREIGLPPGPGYKHILKELRKAWLDGLVTNQEQERKVLKKLLMENEKIQ